VSLTSIRIGKNNVHDLASRSKREDYNGISKLGSKTIHQQDNSRKRNQSWNLQKLTTSEYTGLLPRNQRVSNQPVTDSAALFSLTKQVHTITSRRMTKIAGTARDTQGIDD